MSKSINKITIKSKKMNTEQNTQDTQESQQEQKLGGRIPTTNENLSFDRNYKAYESVKLEGTNMEIVEEENRPSKLVLGMWLIKEGTTKELKEAVERKDWEIIMGVVGATIQLEEKLKELGLNNKTREELTNV